MSRLELLKKHKKHITDIILNSTFKVTIIIFLINLSIQILACAFPILPFLLAFNTGYPLPLLIITALTSAFAHAGWPHLMMNSFVFVPAMMFVESKLGSKTFLKAYLVTALGASIVTLLSANNIADPISAIAIMLNGGVVVGLGSSGAGFGMVALAAFLFGKNPLEFSLGMLILGYLMIEELLKINFFLDGIGHSAHAGGILSAAVFYVYLTRFKSKTKNS